MSVFPSSICGNFVCESPARCAISACVRAWDSRWRLKLEPNTSEALRSSLRILGGLGALGMAPASQCVDTVRGNPVIQLRRRSEGRVTASELQDFSAFESRSIRFSLKSARSCAPITRGISKPLICLGKSKEKPGAEWLCRNEHRLMSYLSCLPRLRPLSPLRVVHRISSDSLNFNFPEDSVRKFKVLLGVVHYQPGGFLLPTGRGHSYQTGWVLLPCGRTAPWPAWRKTRDARFLPNGRVASVRPLAAALPRLVSYQQGGITYSYLLLSRGSGRRLS
jgi:hypothetical protein